MTPVPCVACAGNVCTGRCAAIPASSCAAVSIRALELLGRLSCATVVARASIDC